MNLKEIETKVNQMLLQEVPVEEITAHMNIRLDLGVDSLGLANLMVGLEETFDIVLEASDLDPDAFSTVEDLYRLAKKYMD